MDARRGLLMPLPTDVSADLSNPRFWHNYITADGPSQWPITRLPFPVSDNYSLGLNTAARFEHFRLELLNPLFGYADLTSEEYTSNNVPVTVQCNDLFQWAELDLLGRCIAMRDPSLPHPGPVVALLARFAPVCQGDDVGLIHQLLTTAYHTVGLSTADAEALFRSYDRRRAGFEWRIEGMAWPLLTQDPNAPEWPLFRPNTLRGQDRPFPHDDWHQMLAECRRELEATPAEPWLSRNDGIGGNIVDRLMIDRDLTALAVLADALEEAGCDHPTILHALRDTDYPVRGLWVLEVLTGVAAGTHVNGFLRPTAVPESPVIRFELRLSLTGPHERHTDRPVADLVLSRLRDRLRPLHQVARAYQIVFETNGSSYEAIQLDGYEDVDGMIRTIREVLRACDVSPSVGDELRQIAPITRVIPLS